MAIETLEKVVELLGTPVYAYHEIVHNRHVVETFEKKGVRFVEELSEVPEGATLVYSAHGVSPFVKSEAAKKRLRTVDATCPLVSKVHMEAIRFSKEGYQIVYIGHAGHQEVIGTMGEAPDCIHLVESAEDVDKLTFDETTKLAFLTQTTLSIDDTRRIIDRLKQRFPQIVAPKKDDICYATQNRQDTVKELSPHVDVVLVVGSSKSSNSKRLAEVAIARGIPSHLVSTADEIQTSWLEGKARVLLTAGASTPEPLVFGVIDRLKQEFGATVKEEVFRTESVSFVLPKELRQLGA